MESRSKARLLVVGKPAGLRLMACAFFVGRMMMAVAKEVFGDPRTELLTRPACRQKERARGRQCRIESEYRDPTSKAKQRVERIQPPTLKKMKAGREPINLSVGGATARGRQKGKPARQPSTRRSRGQRQLATESASLTTCQQPEEKATMQKIHGDDEWNVTGGESGPYARWFGQLAWMDVLRHVMADFGCRAPTK